MILWSSCDSFRRGAILLVLVAVLASNAAAQPYDYWRPLLHTEALTDTLPAEIVHYSSYAPNGSNSDCCTNYYGSDSFGWKILCDIEGPGVLTEGFWTKRPDNSSWRCRIFIDNLTTALVDTPLVQLWRGVSPFVPPLADSSSGAFFNYVPIPFQSHLRITVSNGTSIYFHETAYRFPAGTIIPSFTIPPSPDFQSHLDSLAQRFQSSGTPSFSDLPFTSLTNTVTLPVSATQDLLSYDGSGPMRRMMVRVGNHLQTTFENLWVRVYTDNYPLPDLEGPISELFGTPIGWRPYRSLVTGMMGDSLYFNLPVSFDTHLRIEATNLTTASQTVTAIAEIVPDAHDLMGPFEARSLYRREPATRQWYGYDIMKIAGPGNFLGTLIDIQTMNNNWLEGDETMYYDRQAQWFWHGTGVEDYFDGGYNWTNDQWVVTYSQFPFHGCIFYNGIQMGAYRWQLPDAVPFGNYFRMHVEVGPWNNQSGNYRSIALAYATPEHWVVKDAGDDEMSFPGETLRLVGRGLEPGVILSAVTLGGQELTISGNQTVNADSVVDVTVNAPTGSMSGTYPLVAHFGLVMDTVRAAWQHYSLPLLTFFPVRVDLDTLIFAGDTLNIQLAGLQANASATIEACGAVLPWLGTPPSADASGHLQGRVTIPSGLEYGDLTLTALSAGVPDAVCASLLKVRSFWRLEVEALQVTSFQGNRWIEWAPDYLPSNSTEPWGRNLAQHFTGTGAGSYVTYYINVPVSGEYQISYFMGRTMSGSIVRTLVDDSLDLANYDTYYLPINWRWTRTDTLRGTSRYLAAGPHSLRFEITGRSQTYGWKMILDQIVFYPSGGGVPPHAIGDLVARLDTTGIQLTWTKVRQDTVGNPIVVDFYRIYRASVDSVQSYNLIGEVAGTDSAYTDTSVAGAPPGRAFYRVYACSGGLVSGKVRTAATLSAPPTPALGVTPVKKELKQRKSIAEINR